MDRSLHMNQALEPPFALIKHFLGSAIACAVVCIPTSLQAQSIALGGPAAVASAQDFATLSFQDPWDMNERTDFGWFLHGADLPAPNLNNVTFSNGFFSATTGTSPNLFLLETGNPAAARLGKTGLNYPIDANHYKLIAMRMWINGSPQATFGWNRNHLWDGTQSGSNIFNLTPGWRTYFVDLSTLGIRSGAEQWTGLIRSLQFSPSYLNPVPTSYRLDSPFEHRPDSVPHHHLIGPDHRPVRPLSLRRVWRHDS